MSRRPPSSLLHERFPDSSRLPLQQVWPDDLAAHYREAGHWRGETFPAFLRERAERYADDIAVVARDVRLSYAQLWHEAGRIGAGLLALGVRPGERVLVQLGNSAGFITTVCGLFRAGLVPVYALPAHRITELVHFASKAEASAYITTDLHDGFDHRTLARALQAEVPAIREVVIDGDAQEFTALEMLQGDRGQLPADPDPQSVAFLQISGGSTGLSKLIPRTHDDYIYSFRASNAICGIDRDSVYLVALPAAHNFPMSSPGFFGALYAGARVVLSPGPGPDAAFPLIARERVTCCGLVPPLALLWAQAAATSRHDLSSLQVLQVGGAKLVPEAARRVIDGLGCTLQQVFGMAEGLVNYTRLDDPEELIVACQGDRSVRMMKCAWSMTMTSRWPKARWGICSPVARTPSVATTTMRWPMRARSPTTASIAPATAYSSCPEATWWCRAVQVTTSTAPARRSPPRRSRTTCWPTPACSTPPWSPFPMSIWASAAVRS